MPDCGIFFCCLKKKVIFFTILNLSIIQTLCQMLGHVFPNGNCPLSGSLGDRGGDKVGKNDRKASGQSGRYPMGGPKSNTMNNVFRTLRRLLVERWDLHNVFEIFISTLILPKCLP